MTDPKRPWTLQGQVYPMSPSNPGPSNCPEHEISVGFTVPVRCHFEKCTDWPHIILNATKFTPCSHCGLDAYMTNHLRVIGYFERGAPNDPKMTWNTTRSQYMCISAPELLNFSSVSSKPTGTTSGYGSLSKVRRMTLNDIGQYTRSVSHICCTISQSSKFQPIWFHDSPLQES